jgi:hypothetical protein
MISKLTLALLGSLPPLLVSLSSHALAQAPPVVPAVYSGCLAPPATFAHTWFFDPVNGTTVEDGADGSQAHPFSSLNAIASLVTGYKTPLLTTAVYDHYPSQPRIRAGGGGPIAPGDQLLLMSGNYGDVRLLPVALSMDNGGKFLKIAPAPGQHPVLSSLMMRGTNSWWLDGLKIQSVKPPTEIYSYLVTVGNGMKDIVLSNLDVSSADNDLTGWSQAQWNNNGRLGVQLLGGQNGLGTTCVSLTGSHVHHIHTALILGTNNTLVDSNEMDHFGEDAIDYVANHIAITRNDIHDPMDFGISAHADAMQGYPGVQPVAGSVPMYNVFTDIMIDSNHVQRVKDLANPFPYLLQGIDNYNYSGTLITGLTITNNVILTQACAGILFSTIANAVIANNTVLDDGLPNIPGIACVPAITLADTGAGKPPSYLPFDHDVAVFNNISSGLSVNQLDQNVAVHNNVVTLTIPQKGGAIVVYQNGKPGTTAASYTFDGKPGPLPVLGPYNIIDTGGAASEFTTWSPSTLTYNLTPLPGSFAVRDGTQVGAPLTNINGVKRALPPAAVDVGAS